MVVPFRVGRAADAGGELKFHDVDVTDTTVSAAGSIQNSGTLNIIPQGTTEAQRVGRKCTIRSIGLRYDVSLPVNDNTGTPNSGDVLRVIVYLDKQCNGATAAFADILEAVDYKSFNNLSNKGRFRTLLDRTHAINYAGLGSESAGSVSQAAVVHTYSFFKKCTIPIEYDNSVTTGALTSIRSNNIGILLITRSGVAGFDASFRFRFSDS